MHLEKYYRNADLTNMKNQSTNMNAFLIFGIHLTYRFHKVFNKLLVGTQKYLVNY